MSFKIEALNIVYKHWMKEEIRIRKEAVIKKFEAFIENRESVKTFQEIMRYYWKELPITIRDDRWLEDLEFEAFGCCKKCKKNVLRFQVFEYDEGYQVWVECSNMGCRKILIDSCLYINKQV